jgi:hypothetical protein
MANRTLRRAYEGASGDASIHASADGSVSGSDSERGSGVEEFDREPDTDGNISERNTVSDSGSIGVVEVDPSNLTEYIARDSDRGNDNGSNTGKRRGRKPGSKNRAGSKKAQETVEPFLLMAHTWAAVFLRCPEIALEKEEAKQLSDAYSNFCEYHVIPILSPKRMSEINMICALGLVYVPRVIAVRNRIKEEAQVKKARNVMPIQQVQ